MSPRWGGHLNKIDDYRWEIPVSYKAGMRVSGVIYASEKMLDAIMEEQALEQVANVACLPGIVRHSFAMPDIHWGYGFAIGGVAATDVRDGVVSPGGVGYDINCGVRVLRTDLTEEDVRPKLDELVNMLFYNIPSGVGSEGKIKVNDKELENLLMKGARWAVEKGFGIKEDLDCAEENGEMKGADPGKVSSKAKKRGITQVGSLGSGNHFGEVAVVEEIYNPKAAGAMGINGPGQVLVFIHTGSRGLGHQVCDDYLVTMAAAMKKYNITIPDRQLACSLVNSPEGQDYLGAMRAAANFAWANRQCITHWTRETFSRVFNKSWESLGMRLIYDVAHNMAKIEEHNVNGKNMRLCVHRKGATRAFPPGSPHIPARYRHIGQPVLIPGDMGRYSFISTGTERALQETWGSTCHGAGRMQSRHAAKKALKGVDIKAELARRGIIVRATSSGELAEEASSAYKDVAEVVEVTQRAGLSLKVVKSRPMGVIKG